ncbi:MAG: GNAT family N-acetyltransferase [Lysobacterales bacterium]
MSNTSAPPLSAPQIPEILTPRLRLRGHRLDDFDAFTQMQADPVVMQHITGKPLGRDDAWQKFSRSVGHWSLRGFGYWVICDRHSGQFLGEAGFANFERCIDPSLTAYLEAGWVLDRSAHGRGVATEAVCAALSWADAHCPDRPVVCMIDEANKASVRVAEKCGFEPWVKTDFKGSRVQLYRRSASPTTSNKQTLQHIE